MASALYSVKHVDLSETIRSELSACINTEYVFSFLFFEKYCTYSTGLYLQ